MRYGTPFKRSSLENKFKHHPYRTSSERTARSDGFQRIEQYANQIALVAITGASNVTGGINPIHHLAESAHAVGAQIIVDCAQLAPHRKIIMLPPDDPKLLDYVTISEHKIYAPLGTGALIG